MARMLLQLLQKSYTTKKNIFKILFDSTRNVVTKPSGALVEEPSQTQLGMLRVFATVIPGLLIGATISKNMANFLEENDLFVPADDDDDDD